MKPRPSAVIALLLAVWPGRAGADEISDEEDVCRKAELGAACTAAGKAGTCQDSICTRIDYSSQPPNSAERACRKCVEGAPPAKTEAKGEAPAKAEPEAKGEPKAGCTIDAGALSLGSVVSGLALVGLARRRRG